MALIRDRETAPAKLNLALQIIGKYDDGYHEIDSLLAFIEYGDVLEAEAVAHPEITLKVAGEFADKAPAGESNLVLRAAELLRLKSGVHDGARLYLEKRTPVGAGLGGGSADAAAALRLLNRLWGIDFTLEHLADIGLDLGTDVPACVMGVPTRMQGVGEVLSPLAEFPSGMHCVVAYPGTPLLTGDVYRALEAEEYSGELPAFPAIEDDFTYWKLWLEGTRNDLQPVAEHLNDAIPTLLKCLGKQRGSLFHRMSGSGSACFALFEDAESAEAARNAVLKHFPHSWATHTRILHT